MSLFDRFRKPVSVNPDAVTHAVKVSGSTRIATTIAVGSALRRRPTRTHAGSHLADDQAPKRGMWVVYNGQTGILTQLESGDVATVMMVDAQFGTNVLEIHVPAAQLRQAWFEEIPAARRPTYADAVRFGYGRPA